MKLKLKVKRKGKWINVKTSDLINRSIVNYVDEEFDPCSACVFDEQDKPRMIVSNTEEIFKFYDENVFKILASELKQMIDPNIVCSLAASLDEETELFEITLIKPKPDPQVEED